MTINEKIAKDLDIKLWQVSNTRMLIEDGKTLPFIARYRKEITGNLNEIQLREFFDLLDYLKKLQERKNEILKIIEKQGKLTNELKDKITRTEKLSQLEDLYLPYKKKRKTKADVAKENGLEEVSNLFKNAKTKNDKLIESHINESFPTFDEVVNGAKSIITQEINENIKIRDILRNEIENSGILVSKRGNKEDENETYSDYYEFKERFSRLQAYQILALKRGNKNKILTLNLDFKNDPTFRILKILSFNSELAYFDYLVEATETAIKKYLIPSLFNEAFNLKLQESQRYAAEIFAKNLRSLMMQKPLNKKRILAIDPGFRTGCKVVILDEYGKVLDNTVIYPNPPQLSIEKSREVIKNMIIKYGINYIIIGNKTASQETREFVSSVIEKYNLKVKYAMISEDGASVYSASKTAIDEFPEYDVTTRGAISIGRRAQDPMAELVKIPPKSIGVGMYQHDIPPKIIDFVLKREVESAVNYVGVNLNTASEYLLRYISGFNSKIAKNIVEYRKENGPFKDRKELLKVPGIGKKVYEQAAGFCRIPESVNPLDNTVIHPENYSIANKILEYLKTTVGKFADDVDINKINIADIANKVNCSETLAKDIIDGLMTKGIDPREDMPQLKFADKIITINDFKVGDIVEGKITNVVEFGAFVDIGIKYSGLVHRSNISKEFVQDPTKILSVGQILNFRIISIDKKRNRIGLSLKDL